MNKFDKSIDDLKKEIDRIKEDPYLYEITCNYGSEIYAQTTLDEIMSKFDTIKSETNRTNEVRYYINLPMNITYKYNNEIHTEQNYE